jgi:hypothetical protein
MSDKSPLFVSALELIAQATELYATGHPRKYKFAILHLSNGIELILKDCLVDHGVSIYKNPKETITIWGAFEELSKLGINVPEKPLIELLIDDRNTIQHRFGFPNAESVFYYLEGVVAFFVRFLKEQYDVNLAEALQPHLAEENLALLGLIPDNFSHFRKLLQLSPEAAIQQAFATVQGEIKRIISLGVSLGSKREHQISSRAVILFLNELVQKGYLPENIKTRYEELKYARNRAAHGSSSYRTDDEYQTALETSIQILSAIEKAKQDGVIKEAEEPDYISTLTQFSPQAVLEQTLEELDRELMIIRVSRFGRENLSGGSFYQSLFSLLAAEQYLPDNTHEKYLSIRKLRQSGDSSDGNNAAEFQAALAMAIEILSSIIRAKNAGMFVVKSPATPESQTEG